MSTARRTKKQRTKQRRGVGMDVPPVRFRRHKLYERDEDEERGGDKPGHRYAHPNSSFLSGPIATESLVSKQLPWSESTKRVKYAIDEADLYTPEPPASPRSSKINRGLGPRPRAAFATSRTTMRDELLDGEAQVAKMKIGEDAVAYFALHGTETTVKFVYLNRAKTGRRFRPYDLVVVPKAEVEPEHFTMSASGLVHTAPNTASEFTPLSEWMRESTVYNVLSSIKFFKHYLVFKCFRAWRSSIRFNLYCAQRQKLSEKLFWAKISFCAPLLQIQRCFSKMRDIDLVDIKACQKINEVGAFVQAQMQRRKESAKQFELLMDRVQEMVDKTCSDVTKRARISDEDDDDDGRSMDARGALMPHESKAKSMVAMREEIAERERMLKRATQEADMLSSFIRLVDYIAAETLVEVAITSHRLFLQEFAKPARKVGLFETSVRFAKSKIEFSPTKNDILISMGGAERVDRQRGVRRNSHHIHSAFQGYDRQHHHGSARRAKARGR